MALTNATAHATDIYALAATRTQIISGSGESAIKIYSTTSDDYPLQQVLEKAHRLGCHHIATDEAGDRAVSVGFGGEVKIWSCTNGTWKEDGEIKEPSKKAGELWAVVLSLDGQYLAGTTYDGRINVWDLLAGNEKIREYETKGSFGMCIDLVGTIGVVRSDLRLLNLNSLLMENIPPAATSQETSTCFRPRPPECFTLFLAWSSLSEQSASPLVQSSSQLQVTLESFHSTMQHPVSKLPISRVTQLGSPASTGTTQASIFSAAVLMAKSKSGTSIAGHVLLRTAKVIKAFGA